MNETKWPGKVIHLVVALLVVGLVLVLGSSPVPTLAAPAVASVTETAFGSDATNHTVTMPATVNAGDLLIVLFTNDGSATVTTPAGWTALASTASGDQVRLSVYYKIAAGTEGGTTVNFVTSATEEAAAQVYRITDWHGTTPPEISTAATNTTAAPDPSSLNPAGWDVANTLWLAVAGQDQGGGTLSYPASYTGGITTRSSTTGSKRCQTMSARRVLAAASANPGAFTIGTSDEWVAFTIAVRPVQRNLTTSSTEGGSVTTPGEGVFSYDEGAVVDLVATPDAGYRFVDWTGDVDDIDDVWASETTITMNGNYSITANFLAIYDLTISSTEGGSVSEPGEGPFTYDEGTVVDLIAGADACYEFLNWTGDVDTIADVYAASTNITMDAAKNVTANFALLSYNLTADSTDGGSVTDPGEGTVTYDCGTVVDLVAEADVCYEFVNWTGDVGTIADVYAASTNITMNGDYSITATFAPIDCDYLDGWVEDGSPYTACNGTQVCTYQDMVYLDYECVGGECVPTEIDSRTDLIGCEDCDALDGWYDVGQPYACCDGNSSCTCQDQEYRDYYCSDGSCTYSVTDTRTQKTNCTDCDTLDTLGDWEYYCVGNEVWKHQRFQDYECQDGQCVKVFDDYINDTFVEDCDDLDGWYDVGATYACCDGNSSCTCQDQEYRDYYCSDGSCTYSVTDTRTQKTNCTDCDTLDTLGDWEYYCVGNEVWKHQRFQDYECQDGQCVKVFDDYINDTFVEDCDDLDLLGEWEYYCVGNEVWKHQIFHDFSCVDGTCVEVSSEYVNDQFVEDCDAQDGWVEDGDPYTACDGDMVCTYQDMVYLDYSCVGGECVPTEAAWRTDLVGCESCDDGDPCTIDTCENGQCVHTPMYEDILDYYRGLNGDPDEVDTLDLLAAADDWISDAVPACFEEPITTLQLLQLADEWITAGP